MEKVYKSWGWEHWFENNLKYCGKLLYVEFDKWSSKGAYHYHKIKTETFFVIEGSLRLDYVTNKGKLETKILKLYDSFTIPKEMKHRFTALTAKGCKFIEASTTHKDEDSYRVIWGGQGWVPVLIKKDLIN